jgi:DNA repair protein RadD
MNSLQLRPHQIEGLERLRHGFASGHHAQILYGPCAFGKTEVAISMMDGAARKGKRAAMILDRRILCEQTSQRLWKYGIDHGVIMQGSNRWRPDMPIQICTAQTLEKREGFPAVNLLIIDEAHCVRKETAEFIKRHPEVKVVGLSGSPFAKGLGAIYSNVESAVTIDQLVSDKWLVSPRVFIAKEIDMTGAKKIAGEWSAKDATTGGLKITGDIVSEWVTKTNEIFGGPRKTIVFCAGVAHGEALAQKFAEAGFNFVSISYKDDDEFKSQAIEDFNRPDTEIDGLIATDLLTKGFDCSDVMIGVSARPFSKSFSSHVQQIGRVMRPHEGKDQAIWLCHSGNYLRFQKDWDQLCSDGVSELDDGAEKPKPEPTSEQKDAAKCPSCGQLWPGQSDTCSHCGFVRVRKSAVIEVPGEMFELSSKPKKDAYSMEYKTAFYAQLLGYAEAKGQNLGSAYHRYHEKFGVYPSMAKPDPQAPTFEVIQFIRSRNIAYAKKRSA